jgi:outer membrane protein insertion porin family
VGGGVDFVRPEGDFSHYLTAFKLKDGGKHILELHLHAAAIESYGGTRDVPPFLRYYAGGIDTVRGFQFRSITPIEYTRFIGGEAFQIGGKREVFGTAEYSLPLYEDILRASVFADAGSVFDAGQTDPHMRVVNTSGLRISAGLGLSIRTPLSPTPIRLYFSQAVRQNTYDRTKFLDFSFGTRF